MKARPWFRGMLWGTLVWGWLTIGFWIEAMLPVAGGEIAALWMCSCGGAAVWNMVAWFVESEKKNKW